MAEGVQDVPGAGRFAWVTDPQGGRIELRRPARRVSRGR